MFYVYIKNSSPVAYRPLKTHRFKIQDSRSSSQQKSHPSVEEKDWWVAAAKLSENSRIQKVCNNSPCAWACRENSPSNSRGLRLQRQRERQHFSPPPCTGMVKSAAALLSLPLFSSLQCPPHSSIRRSHAASPSECMSRTEREKGGQQVVVVVVVVLVGGVSGMQGPCVCVCVWVHRNVRKSTPYKTHQQRQQQLQLIVLQRGLTVAAQLREREAKRGSLLHLPSREGWPTLFHTHTYTTTHTTGGRTWVERKRGQGADRSKMGFRKKEEGEEDIENKQQDLLDCAIVRLKQPTDNCFHFISDINSANRVTVK